MEGSNPGSLKVKQQFFRKGGADQEVRLRRSAEAECAPKNRRAKEYLGGGWGRAFVLADWFPQGSGKMSADRLLLGLQAGRSPPRKSAGAARRPSRDASFSEARGCEDVREVRRKSRA